MNLSHSVTLPFYILCFVICTVQYRYIQILCAKYCSYPINLFLLDVGYYNFNIHVNQANAKCNSNDTLYNTMLKFILHYIFCEKLRNLTHRISVTSVPIQFSIANICPKVSQIKFKIWIFLCRFSTRTLAGDKCGDGNSSGRGRIQRTYSIFLSYISKEPISVHMEKGNEFNFISDFS